MRVHKVTLLRCKVNISIRRTLYCYCPASKSVPQATEISSSRHAAGNGSSLEPLTRVRWLANASGLSIALFTRRRLKPAQLPHSTFELKLVHAIMPGLVPTPSQPLRLRPEYRTPRLFFTKAAPGPLGQRSLQPEWNRIGVNDIAIRWYSHCETAGAARLAMPLLANILLV